MGLTPPLPTSPHASANATGHAGMILMPVSGSPNAHSLHLMRYMRDGQSQPERSGRPPCRETYV